MKIITADQRLAEKSGAKNLIVSPSGVGTFLLAMALGKCVIMTESPATRGVLEHEHTAILVPMNDADARFAGVHVSS